MAFVTIDPDTSSIPEVHGFLLGGVAPRPIALVATVSAQGVPNLSPFSFFNAVGANPPTVAFSPSRRGRTGTTKDTLNNIRVTGECTIQAVTWQIVHQVNLASTEYPEGINEFAKAGLTPIASEMVKPPRVAESPFQMECKVIQIVELGSGPASGNLVICQVVLFHVDQSIMRDGRIDATLIEHCGRNGGSYYTRVGLDSLFELPKPPTATSIGFDQLPAEIRRSTVLSGADLASLALAERAPDNSELARFEKSLAAPSTPYGHSLARFTRQDGNVAEVEAAHRAIKEAIAAGDLEFARLAAFLFAHDAPDTQ